MIAEGEPGQSGDLLDHQFQENVYDSMQAKGVGGFLTGYLKMENLGRYRFKAMANDGIQVPVVSLNSYGFTETLLGLFFLDEKERGE